MVNEFVLGEILLFLVPAFIVHYIKSRQGDFFTIIQGWPLSYSILLLPLCMSLIKAFSLLIFSYSLLSLAIFLTIFILFIHLYDFIKGIPVFHFRDYYLPAARIAFLSLSAFLLGLVILRIYTYFIL